MTDNDQAAVEALCKISLPPVGVNITGEYAVPYRDGARAILDAIRAGKVPWVRIAGDEECLPLERARNAKLRAEVERLNEKLLNIHTDIYYKGRRDAEVEATARAEKAASERDRLKGLLRNAVHAIDTRFNKSLVGDIEEALAEIGGGK